MSKMPSTDPACHEVADSALALRIEARQRDLGGFSVARLLPVAQQRSVGPFIFFDHFGPTRFETGKGIDVRPHPHINLATVTYLFAGAIDHRDSLGSHQRIEPGAINWMVAGRGIVHSERTPAVTPDDGYDLHGIQLWLGLPEADEEAEPSFVHHPAETLPAHAEGGVNVRVLAGEAYGHRAPARVFSPMIYADITLQAGASIQLPDYEERAVYPINGEVRVDGVSLERVQMGIVAPGDRTLSVPASAEASTRVMLIGGAPLGVRHMWWNFVSSRKERIEQAKSDWAQDRFETVVGDEDDRIPLPES